MTSYLDAHSDGARIRAFAGGKGTNLHRLSGAGLPVPTWVAIPSKAIQDFAVRSGLAPQIERTLSCLRPETVRAVSGEITEQIQAARFDPAIVNLVTDAYRSFAGRRVAVRSSAQDEDGTGLSFAGQFSSFLDVEGETDVLHAVRSCWASLYSERALAYRLAHDLSPLGSRIAVVIQEMVAADRSGVFFTANPISGNDQELVISATQGLGDGLVSGTADADTLVVDWTTGDIIQTSLAGPSPSVDLDDIRRIHAMARRIEAIFRQPVDVEWAIVGDTLSVLQARPITTVRSRRHDRSGKRIWDNSNIIESYDGQTTPLTFTYARNRYHYIFREHYRRMGVPERYLAKLDRSLGTLIGYHNDHVYYNMTSWYKVMSIAPFRRLRRRMVEIRMGARRSQDHEREEFDPFEGASRLEKEFLRVKVGLFFFSRLLCLPRPAIRFFREFAQLRARYESCDYGAMPSGEIAECLRAICACFPKVFGRTTIFEPNISLNTGLLAILTRRWLPAADELFFVQLIEFASPPESVEPAKRLRELAELAHGSDALRDLLRTASPHAALETLLASDQADMTAFWVEFNRYIEAYGSRSLNELKLEEPDFTTDPAPLLAMVADIMSQLGTAPGGKRGHRLAELILDRHLHGWRRLAFDLVRRRVVSSLLIRERIRFCRTREFALVRRVVVALGDALTRSGMLQRRDDIFLLRLDELFGWVDGVFPSNEIAAIVEIRRHHWSANARLKAPTRFTTEGIIWHEDFGHLGWEEVRQPDAAAETSGTTGCQLSGVPCSPGIVEGEAILVDAPRDVGGKILVTRRTDPGWCGVLQSAAALLVERGSPLNHVAIVARELGVPTVMQVDRLTATVKTGQRLRVDGAAGTVRLLATAPEEH